MPSPPPLALVPKADDSLAERDDDQLMVLAAAGVQAAFQVLVERHHVRLASYCIKATGERGIGEEIAQECWLRVWSHRLDYRPIGRFAVFLYSIARNRCRNARRDRLRRDRFTDATEAAPEEVAAPTADDLDRLIVRERQRRVFAALDELPERMREALMLRYGQELEYPEIAAIVESPEGTIRSRVHHALDRLRQALWRKEEP